MKKGKATFLFKFVKTGTTIPVALPKYELSFYDIDQTEKITACGAETVSVELDGKVTSKKLKSGCTQVSSKKGVRGVPNPSHVLALTSDQKKASATYTFKGASEVEVSFAHSGDFRNFWFCGFSYVKSAVPGPKPCQSEVTSLNLKEVVQNNLGGKGPDTGKEELRFTNVVRVNDVNVDLVVEVMGTGTYSSSDPEQNGVKGEFANLNLNLQTNAPLAFTFVKEGTRTKVSLPGFAFSFYDIDGPVGGESMEVCGAEKAMVDPRGEVAATSKGDCTTVSNSVGGSVENPSSAVTLSDDQIKRSATFIFGKTSTFQVTLAVKGSGDWTRNLLFSGVPVLDC